MARTAKNTDARNTRANGNWQGMNWIRQEKRLAIYLRDGLACAYCGQGVESGITFTLDHITPHSLGGSNKETNLVTCCHTCNSARGARPVADFAAAVAGYLNHGVTTDDVLAHIAATTKVKLAPFKVQAKEMIARRGSAARVLANMATN